MSVRETLLLPSVLVKWVLTALNNTYLTEFLPWQFAAPRLSGFFLTSAQNLNFQVLGMHGELLSISGTKISPPRGSSEWQPSLLRGECGHIHIWSLPSELPMASCCSSLRSPLKRHFPRGASLIPSYNTPSWGQEMVYILICVVAAQVW